MNEKGRRNLFLFVLLSFMIYMRVYNLIVSFEVAALNIIQFKLLLLS